MPFRRELAALVARSPSGQAAAWPVVETVQVDGICREVVAPAPDLPGAPRRGRDGSALRIAGELGVVGVLAVEMFETADGRVLVNELAMRPHNSGHWTIDGAVTASSSSTCGRCSTCRWATRGPARRGRSWSTCSAATTTTSTGPTCTSWPATRASRCTCTARRCARAARSATSPSCGDDLEDCRARARHAADFITGVDRRVIDLGDDCAVGETPTLGVGSRRNPFPSRHRRCTVVRSPGSIEGVTMAAANGARRPVVGVVMGSDSDWPVMEAASKALDEFGVPHEVDVVSAHRMPHEMLEYGARRSRAGPAGDHRRRRRRRPPARACSPR